MLHFFRITGAEHDGIGIGSRLELAIFPSIGILWICGAAPVAVGLALGPPVVTLIMERFYSWVVLECPG